jgi:hypothetical protein
MRKLRWLLPGLIVIAAAVALAPLVPLGSLKPEAEARLSEFFNSEVEIGSMRLSLLGGPYLVLRSVTVGMSPEFGGGNLLEAENDDHVASRRLGVSRRKGEARFRFRKVEFAALCALPY